jgi:hypothetical protein
VLVVFHGCASTFSFVEFEVLEPATVTLPENVNRLVILNRAPVTLDAFREEDRENVDQIQLVLIDTLIINSILRGLLDIFRQSPAPRFHDLVWLNDRRHDTTSLDDLILTRREVDEICTLHEAGAIVSLESYFMDLDMEVRYYPDDRVVEQTKYYLVSTILRWIIYLPGTPRPFDTYTIKDTLFFSEFVDGVFMGYHPTAQMIRDAFYSGGLKYGRYLVPRWVNTSRTLFKGREEQLRQASRQTNQGNWDSAFAIWSGLTESSDSTLAAKAFHNMAVYYELEDQLDSASLLVNRSLEFDTLQVVRSYKEELDTRIMNRNELLNQVR